jgi:hypothetical protein
MTTWETIGTRANRANNAPVAPVKGTEMPLKKRCEPIAEQGNGTNDKDRERLSFGSLSGASRSLSSARNTRDMEPISPTPEILHIFNRLKPDKGKNARLLTEHTTGHRQLPSTKQEV